MGAPSASIVRLTTVEIKKKIATVATSVVDFLWYDSRFFVDFSSDFSGKMEEFVQNGLKIFKISRQNLRRLRPK
jgi:hypothetical protein